MSRAGRFLQRWSRLRRPGQTVEPEAAANSDPDRPVGEGQDIEAEFSAFLKREVSESLRRAALRKLSGDPHFNLTNGLDICIGDHSGSDPIQVDLTPRVRPFDTFLRAETEAPRPAHTVAEDGAGPRGLVSEPRPCEADMSTPGRDSPGNGDAASDSTDFR